MDVVDACKKIQQKLIGTWGVVVLSKTSPNRLIAMKNGSPLLVGIGAKRMFIASEPSAFARYTREYIALQDMEIAVISPGDDTLLDLSRVEKHEIENFPLNPGYFLTSTFFVRPLSPLDDQGDYGTTNRSCECFELRWSYP